MSSTVVSGANASLATFNRRQRRGLKRPANLGPFRLQLPFLAAPARLVSELIGSCALNLILGKVYFECDCDCTCPQWNSSRGALSFVFMTAIK